MEWLVRRAQNIDVERTHLNKILQEVQAHIDTLDESDRRLSQQIVAALAASYGSEYSSSFESSVPLFGPTQRLDELHDVTISSPLALHSIGYNGSQWVNAYPTLFESDGILSGCEIQTLSATQIRITAGRVGFTDYVTSSTNPPRSIIIFPQTDVTITGIAIQPETYVAIKNDGTVQQQAGDWTNTQRRTHAPVGIAVHTNLVSINVVNKLPGVVRGGINTLHDFLIYHGREHKGLVYSPNGVNLNINRTAGSLFLAGGNFYTNPLDPNVIALASGTALTFRYRTMAGEPAGDITAINPNLYNTTGGTLVAVPANDWTAQPVYVFPSGLTRIQYGQQTWPNLADAVVSFRDAPFTVEGNLSRNGVRVGWVIVREGAVDLSNPARALFVPDAGAGAGSSTTSNLTSTDFLPEGVTNLYYTEARAKAVAMAVAGIALMNSSLDGEDGSPGAPGPQGPAGVGGGGSNSVTTTVTFTPGFSDKAAVVVTGQTWVTATSEIVAHVRTPTGTDVDEMYLLDFRVVISNLVVGIGFTITVYTEVEATGSYDIMCIGV